MMTRCKFLSHLSLRIFSVIVLVLLVPSIIMVYMVKGSMENLLQEEIVNRVVRSLQQGETEIAQVFSNMVNISNAFYINPEFSEAFNDDSTSYYERYVVFQKLLSDLSVQNLYHYSGDFDSAIDQFKITFSDQEGHIYTNWGQNYQDYSYLFEQEWLSNAVNAPGFIIWNLQGQGYTPKGIGAKNDQVVLARSLYTDNRSGNIFGILLISIGCDQIAKTLSTYRYSTEDIVFASTTDDGVLFVQGMSDTLASSIVSRYLHSYEGNDVVDDGDNTYLLSYYTIKRANPGNKIHLKVFYLTDYNHIRQNISRLVTGINLGCALFTMLVVAIAFWTSITISRPVRRLSMQMQAYNPGDLPVAFESSRTDEIGQIERAYHSIMISIHDLLERLKKEEEIREKYHYESLKAKMSPHFLFNTLTTIRWMAIMRKADNIRQSIDSLAAILNYTMNDDETLVPLSKEIDVIKNYCEIHNLCSGNRDRLELHIDDSMMELRIIKFILQPAVENCFKHAFLNGNVNGIVLIKGTLEGENIVIQIDDNGPGFSLEAIEAFQTHIRQDADNEIRSGSIGLSIVHERIMSLYGHDYGIELGTSEMGGARVTYYLPVISSIEKE